MKVGVPASVQPLLRTQSVNGMVYPLTHAPFDSNRLMVRELDSGRIYLCDVEATKAGGPIHPIQIYVKEPHATETTPVENQDAGQLDYVQLIRFTAPTRPRPWILLICAVPG